MEIKIQSGVNKLLLRRSMKGIVPDTILNRGSKGDLTPLVYVGLKAEWNSLIGLLDEVSPILSDFVDMVQFKDELTRWRNGYLGDIARIFGVLTLAVWLRSSYLSKDVRPASPPDDRYGRAQQ